MKLWKAVALAAVALAVGAYVGFCDGRIYGHNETMRSLVRCMEASK